MVLEATMVLVDNSDWMRNGDYTPSRLQAQADAVNLLAGAKTQDNPESSVGVLSFGGLRPRVIVALTQELGEILSRMSQLSMEGQSSHLSQGVQMAQLALKHRQNKNQRQRVVLFVGSPIPEDEDALISLGKKLKKNSVALDIVDMSSDSESTRKLEALLTAVNSSDNSHLITIPSLTEGGGVVSDILLSSPVFGETGGTSGFAAAAAASAAAAQGGADGINSGLDEFGIDPTLDPELALALRVSMEEERARQQASKEREDGANKADGEIAVVADTNTTEATGNVVASGVTDAVATADDVEMMDEDELLQQALAMSMGQPTSTSKADVPVAGDAPEKSTEIPSDLVDDPELAMALKMSMDVTENKAETGTNESKVATEMVSDPSYVASVLGSLPGVDPNDPAVLAALAALNPSTIQDEKKETDEDEMDEE